MVRPRTPPTHNTHNDEKSAVSRPRTQILVVDDNEDLREVLASLLEVEGYAPCCCASAGDALHVLHDGLRPAVIILDWMMPGMNGEEFLEQVRSDPSLLGIPVVVVSAAPVAKMLAHEAAVPCLGKPFRAEALLALVAHLARSEGSGAYG